MPTPTPTHRTTASVLRIRSAAAMGDNIIGRLPKGTVVVQLRKGAAPWVRVDALLRDGILTGWVSRDHLAPVDAPAPVDGPAWLRFARAEVGVKEHPGEQQNPRILEYHATTALKATTDETPWCSAFVNWCMKQAGVPGTGSAAARSWLNWGKRLNKSAYGCVVVFDRSDRNNPHAGHVGFYLETTGTGLQVLGGNQSNSVRISSYPAGKVLGYRMKS